MQKKLGDDISIPPHDCVKNHEGSSKSMECEALLQLAKEAPARGFYVRTVVSDDDTTMKKTLRHDYNELVTCGRMRKEDWPRNDKNIKLTTGRLPMDIPTPNFLADFNHRVKSVGNGVYELAKQPLKVSMVRKPMAKRIKYYWGCVLNQVKDLKMETEWDKIVRRMKAPLEHLFDDHTYCDIEWCYSPQAKK